MYLSNDSPLKIKILHIFVLQFYSILLNNFCQISFVTPKTLLTINFLNKHKNFYLHKTKPLNFLLRNKLKSLPTA